MGPGGRRAAQGSTPGGALRRRGTWVSYDAAADESGYLSQLMPGEDAEQPRIREDSTALDSLTRDWLTAGPRSEWTRRVVRARILNQDRVRPFVTRGALLVALAGCLVLLDAPAAALAWLLLGVLQTVLEIALERTLRSKYELLAQAPTAEGPLILRQLGRGRNVLVRIWYWNVETSITNATGLLGTVAAAGNLVVVVVFTTSDGNAGWLRVLALVIATAYLASGALGPLADVAMYSPATSIPTWLAFVLRWLWVGVVALVIGVMLAGEGSAWEWGESLPYAVIAVVAIGYYPMLRCRELERAMAAAADVAESLAAQRYASIALDLHTLLQVVKGPLRAAAQVVPDPADRADLDRFLRDMEYVYRGARNRTIDLSQGLGMPLEDHLRFIGSAEMVRLEVDLDVPADVPHEHIGRVRRWLLALTDNSVQAYRFWPDEDQVPMVRVRARLDGPDMVLEVSDLLDLLPADLWNDPGSTLHKIRLDVEALGGQMQQLASGSGGKTIVLRWPVLTRLTVRASQEDS
jgi:hypothetical protein